MTPRQRVARALAPTHSLGQDIPLEDLLLLAEECLRRQSAG